MGYLLGPGLPAWLELTILFIGGLGAALLGWCRGRQFERQDVAASVEREIQKRRNSLADRGRTTERRPEHDGQQPAVNHKIQLRSTRAPAPDKRGDQRF